MTRITRVRRNKPRLSSTLHRIVQYESGAPAHLFQQWEPPRSGFSGMRTVSRQHDVRGAGVFGQRGDKLVNDRRG
jgi:hypothetical protein